MNRDFLNNASPAERIAQLHNERRLRQGDQPPWTFFAQSQVGRRLDGSSNYEAERDLVVAGESAATLYPRLPDSSPWSGAGAQVPPEEPLGVAIDQQECTGTPAELAASLDDPVSPFNRQMDGQAGAPATFHSPVVAGVATPAAALPVAVGEDAPEAPRSASPLLRPGASIPLRRRKL
jgi:hypothetical protein